MIDAALFARIHQQFGHVASWAVWADAGTRPKDHVGDLSVLSPHMNPTLLDTLHTKFVLMGLNISRALEHPVERPFGNFHDDRPISQDYKIRYALKDTPLWGAYMTDVIKEYTERTAGSVVAYLRKNRDVEQAHIAQLRAEMTRESLFIS